MDTNTTDQMDEIEKAAQDMADRILTDMTDIMGKRDTIGNATINVNAGGLGIWLVTTLAIAMFCMFITLAVSEMWVINKMSSAQVEQDQRIARQNQKIDRQQDYLNIILQWAPELKKKMNQQKEK